MLKIGYNAVYNYVYREKSLIARICSSPISHVLSDIQCTVCRRRQWAAGEESVEEKERKETQEGLGDATVDGGSARVEDVREEDKAITRSLNISDSNLACVRRRVDRVEEEMEDLRNMVKGMTIDGGGQVERAQARTVEEPKSHDGWIRGERRRLAKSAGRGL